MDVAVIGSGVAGVFAARALAARGSKVTILDVGETLDSERQKVVTELHALDARAWPLAQRALISANPTMDGDELPKKMHFGSDYIMPPNVRSLTSSPAATGERLIRRSPGAASPISGVRRYCRRPRATWPTGRFHIAPWSRISAR